MALQLNNVKGEEVIDPYNNKKKYEENWDRKFKQISSRNRKIIAQYVRDMEAGRNVSGSKKGRRGYHHLNSLISRLTKISELVDKRYHKKITDISAIEIHDLFKAMEEGEIKSGWGKRYKSTHDYIKIFKAFWHWHMKIKRNEYNSLSDNERKKVDSRSYLIQDITQDLSGAPTAKPDFVYFTFEELQKMMHEAKFKYQVLMLFMFDSGIRSPTELMNVKRKDITPLRNSDKLQIQVRDETSKTFGRKFKLMLCSGLLKEHFAKHNFGKDDFIFKISPPVVNRYLRRLSIRVFGENLEGLSENKGNKNLTMYDFRHSSCCYWLPRYKSESALKYRFGWKESSMIHYYSEFLGMKDTIEEEDLLVDVTKTDLENELERQKQQREIMEDRLANLEKSWKKVDEKRKPRDDSLSVLMKDKEFSEFFLKKLKEKGLVEKSITS